MISCQVMRDLAQLSGLIVGWGLFIGCGISGIALAVAITCWVVDFIRKELQ